MSPVAAPKCQHEGCQNPTWHTFCHHHQSGNSGVQNSPSLASAQPTQSLNFLHYANVSDLWSDLLGAFPDAGDVVQPKTIRQEAVDTLSAAVDSEAYRRFPELDVADPAQREALVEQMREQLVRDLLPEPSHVTGAQARELSYSSSDQYGRSAEDSRYLASFALNAEWECARILGAREDISFEHFVQRTEPEMREAIDMSFRRNLGDFADIVRQVSHREPLNSDPIAPHLVITPIKTDSDPNVIPGEVVNDPSAEIADWFENQRQYQANNPTPPPPPHYQPTVQYPAQPEYPQQYPVQQGHPQQGYQQYPPQQAEPQETVLGVLGKIARNYIDDPDGKRLAAKQERERKARERQRIEDERLDRELKKELLRGRQKRNNSGRGWW